MNRILLLITILSIATHKVHAQGCMAIRQIAGFGPLGLMNYDPASGSWMLNVNNRYFNSFRTFKGTEDQHTPRENQVINKTYTLDLTLLHMFANDWSIAFSLPISANSRSTKFEHGGTRHTTHSFGIGDIRLMGYKWLLKSATHHKGNIQLGLGLKFPSGDFRFMDFYYVNDTTRVLNPVDQSIQLGDGGTGIIFEMNAFYRISQSFNTYGSFFYMSNPREQNGVSTAKNAPVSSLAKKAGSDVMSVPDQYTARAGIAYLHRQLALELGIRAEGVPVYDLIGGSGGLRRAGYNISIEPGITYRMKKAVFYTYVPVSLKRSISQSYTDKNISAITGTFTISPGGFPDYMIFIGATFAF